MTTQTTTDATQWLRIHGYSDYECNMNGDVRTFKDKRIIPRIIRKWYTGDRPFYSLKRDKSGSFERQRGIDIIENYGIWLDLALRSATDYLISADFSVFPPSPAPRYMIPNHWYLIPDYPNYQANEIGELQTLDGEPVPIQGGDGEPFHYLLKLDDSSEPALVTTETIVKRLIKTLKQLNQQFNDEYPDQFSWQPQSLG